MILSLRRSGWVSILAVILFPLLTLSRPFDGVEPTAVLQSNEGISPVITEAPSVARGELRKRQGGETCGYVNANINSPLGCQPGYQCAINPYNYAAGCCQNPQSCAYHTQCIPYQSLANCGASCSSNPFITKCTNTASPYCFVKYFVVPGYNTEFYDVDCEASSGSLTLYRSFTNTGFPTTAANTPQYIVVTATPSAVTKVTTATMVAAASQVAGSTAQTIVECGQGGSSDTTCNVGSGNNGNGHSGAAASPKFMISESGLLFQMVTFWVLMELFTLAFS